MSNGMGAVRWKRLQRIRGLQEQQARVNLERANLALHAAESAVGEQLRQRTAAGRASRAALLAGDRVEWHMAEAAREVSEWTLERLEQERKLREAAVEPAKVEFFEKRMADEQMKVLRKKMEAVELDERRHVEQQSADEWFGQQRGRITAEER